jgi:3-methyladenine DNA glycosylase AlkD
MPPTLSSILTRLRSLRNPLNVAGMARFGIVGDGRLGISMPALRTIAKETGKDHRLALQLWATHIPEAMIVAGMVAEPSKLTLEEADRLAGDFCSWDVCDQTCLNLFAESPLAWKMVSRWAQRKEEFVRRAAFALIACLAVHDKTADDRKFIAALKRVGRASTDERNFVKKAVNWALRGIGKRNLALHAAALDVAQQLRKSASPSARWVGSDAVNELEKPAILRRIKLPPARTGSSR